MKQIRILIFAALVLSAAASAVLSAPVLRVKIVDGIFMRLAACEDVDSFYVYNNGDGLLEWSVTCDESWVSFDPVSGSNVPGVENRTYVRVTFDRTGLADGEYRPRIRVVSNGGDKWFDPYVTVHELPLLTVIPSEILVSLDDTAGEFSVRNGGRQPLDWAMSTSTPWITIDPPLSGTQECTSNRVVSYSLNPAALPSTHERHVGRVEFASNGGNRDLDVIYLPPAQEGGFIGLYADAAATSCNLVSTPASLLQVYIFHMRHTGMTASQFAAPVPDCLNASWLGDQGMWPTQIGNSQDGLSLGYGGCLAAPTYLMLINYFVEGDVDPCCLYPVLPDPHRADGEIVGVDCSGNLVVIGGGTAVVNANAGCSCSDGGDPVLVEETTWGRIKMMYR
jgi:hypothetical protein